MNVLIIRFAFCNSVDSESWTLSDGSSSVQGLEICNDGRTKLISLSHLHRTGQVTLHYHLTLGWRSIIDKECHPKDLTSEHLRAMT